VIEHLEMAATPSTLVVLALHTTGISKEEIAKLVGKNEVTEIEDPFDEGF
jgi:hypothetical protein